MQQETEKTARCEAAVAWRDRYIKELSELLAGREEETRLLAAFVQYFLAKQAEGNPHAVTLEIPKAEISAALDRVAATVIDAGTCYRLTLTPREAAGGKDAAGSNAEA